MREPVSVVDLEDHHRGEVQALLERVGLPFRGVGEGGDGETVALIRAGKVAGCAGVEVREDLGLLRSVAVDPTLGGGGLGTLLVRDRIHWARARGLLALYAVTLIPEFFERLGFERAERSSVPGVLLSTPTFQGMCPDTAAVLVLPLGDAGEKLIATVRENYGRHARRFAEQHPVGTTCCGEEPACSSSVTTGNYDPSVVEDLPAGVVSSSLGCGSPTVLAVIQPGETVLDLGSGAGLDLLLASQAVGPGGKVYGLDMTGEMIELARRNIRKAGADNVELLEGRMESIPLPDASVDVVLSNCVINLSPDKRSVLREVHRVLRPGGRVAVSDIVVFGRLPEEIRRSAEAWAGCVAGALEAEEYRSLLRAAGFTDVEVQPTRHHDAGVAAGAGASSPTEGSGTIASASVRARKPSPG